MEFFLDNIYLYLYMVDEIYTSEKCIGMLLSVCILLQVKEV